MFGFQPANRTWFNSVFSNCLSIFVFVFVFAFVTTVAPETGLPTCDHFKFRPSFVQARCLYGPANQTWFTRLLNYFLYFYLYSYLYLHLWCVRSDQFWIPPRSANQIWFSILRLRVSPLSERVCVFWPKPFNIPSPCLRICICLCLCLCLCLGVLIFSTFVWAGLCILAKTI